ncbi:MAG: response regulator transcription factor [Cyclobacteriaceae bacterium]|nr:response regulator transcription factor [Cyclobacteriaceae bacterium]
MIKVAIVEDIDDIRKGLAMIVNTNDSLECKHTFADADKAFAVLSVQPVDVVLVDINLPGGINGIELVHKLKPVHPHMQFMMCTVYEDSELVFKALKVGATGYILKKTPPAKLLEAIQEIYEGGSPMSAQIARKVISSFQKPVLNDVTQLLTKREQELLDLLAQGFRYKEIADKLSLSIDTIRTHIRNIYRKLEVQSRAEALNKIYPH